jgi:hypothetical protein
MSTLLLALALQQAGIASRYPGDAGIEKDPRVLFSENFESGDVASIAKRWGDCGHPEHLALTDDVPPGSPGKRSMRIQFGHLYTHFRGADRVYARYSIKFHPKTGYTHHLPFLLADGEPTPWPKGFAGKKPAGDNFFGSALDAWGDWGTNKPPGKWILYSYWHEMKPDGKGNYWGNNFKAPQDPIEPGRWYTVEFMIKANSSPDAADGEQAFWVDGRPIGEVKGLRWRTTDALKLNSFWLLHDGHTEDLNKDAEHPNRIYELWFDDLVVATDYIGPRAARVVYSESFDSGPGKFTGGEVVDGALSIPPKGVEAWNAWSVTVGETTSVKFRLKPTVDLDQVSLLMWSDKLKDNARYYVTGLRKGEWKTVEFRGVDARAGWAMDGPCLDGSVLNNLKLVFEGPADARVLLDDVEIRE